MIIVDGDYHSGRQVRVIGSTNFNVTRDIKEITVAISDTIGNTSFRNNTNAHVKYYFIYKGLWLVSPWANLIISKIL